jgi:hypothetical protein
MTTFDGLADGLIVFALGIIIALLRFAWIGYFKTHQDEFIQLTPQHEGNQIFIKTPRRRKRGSHMIVINEQVDEGSSSESEREDLSGDETEMEEIMPSPSLQQVENPRSPLLPGDALHQLSQVDPRSSFP